LDEHVQLNRQCYETHGIVIKYIQYDARPQKMKQL